MLTLHIDTGAEMRGGQWQALYLLQGLAARGHKARLLARKNSPLLEAAVAAGLDARPWNIAALPGAASHVDLVHAHDARAHTLALLSGKPVVVSRRVAFPVNRGLASRWKYMRATHFIAVSHYVAQELLDAGVDRIKISMVYDGVPIPAAEEPASGKVVALDSDDPGKCKKIVEAAAAMAGTPVIFSRNLQRDLGGAAAFVYLTSMEGLGSAALLASAHGVPVIASSVGGLPEAVEDGVTGLLVSNESEEVAQALRRLALDGDLRARLGANGRARAEKDFSVDRMVSGTLDVYERMLA